MITDLHWLHRDDITLPLPELVYGDANGHCGLYFFPHDGEECIGGRFYSRRNGIIVVDPTDPEEIPSTLAHEWRHHWQAFNGWNYDGRMYWGSTSSYDEALRNYFTRSRSEYDALRYERQKAPSSLNEDWFHRIVHDGQLSTGRSLISIPSR